MKGNGDNKKAECVAGASYRTKLNDESQNYGVSEHHLNQNASKVCKFKLTQRNIWSSVTLFNWCIFCRLCYLNPDHNPDITHLRTLIPTQR